MPRDQAQRFLPVVVLVVVALVSIALTAPSAGAATTLTIAPSADGYVRADHPTTNYGTATSVDVDNSPVKQALLKFAVSGVGTNSVSSAKLRLYNVNGSSVGGRFYRTADTSWGESTVNWNSAPVVDPTPIATLGRVASSTWYEVDLTSLVTKDGTYSLRVTSTTSDGAAYTSREGAAAFRPQLVVVSAPPADTTPPSASITSPANGAAVSGAITVRADASDDVGVTSVDLSVDGVLRGTDPTAPYTFTWDSTSVANGLHDLVAIAHDGAGHTGSSPVVTVSVSNGGSVGGFPTRAEALARPSLVVETGTLTTPYRVDPPPPNTTYDLRGLTSLAYPNASTYPLSFKNASGLVTVGGRVDGQQSTALTWQQVKDIGGGALQQEAVDWTVAYDLVVRNVEDGYKPRVPDGTEQDTNVRFLLEGAYMSYIRDDAVEDDDLMPGYIRDSLIDGAFAFLSASPYPAGAYTNQGMVVTIDDTIVRLQAMPSDVAADGTGNGKIFKWQQGQAGSVVVRNSVFFLEDVPEGSSVGFPDGTYQNVTIVLGPGFDGDGDGNTTDLDYPASLPAGVTQTRSVSVFTSARDAWLAGHGYPVTTDTARPSPPTNLAATAPTATRVSLSWRASTDDGWIDHYVITRDGVQVGTSNRASFIDTFVSPATTYGYSVTAYDGAGNPSDPSATASATTPSARTSVVFAAAGDHGANSRADASLAALDASGADFYLALGDLDYDETPTDAAWCDYVKTRLPTLGPTYPFELVSGNHEEQGGSTGYIMNHAACLPDRLGATPGPGSVYGAEYAFDYPAGSPLVRAIMIAPGLTIENVTYNYVPGSPHYDWLVSTIDGARAAGIPWVVVGMHYFCVTTTTRGCGMGQTLWNLLIQKKVDLVLHGHDHNYQRGKQLALNPLTCPTVPSTGYDPDCVIDDGSDGSYPKGAGTVDVIAGTFGRGQDPVNASDPEAPYFAKLQSSSWGFMRYTVSADRIDARFVDTAGVFTDAFSIQSGGVPSADRNPPSAPTNLSATARNGTTVDLAWTASIDDVAMGSYSILRDGLQIGTSLTTTYTDTTANPGQTHSYSVTAYDAAGNPSAPSSPVSVTMPGVGPVLTFGPAADATIVSGSAGTNFGAATSLEVDNSPVKHFLLRFTVTGVGSRGVAGAKLRLYCVNSSNLGGAISRVGDNSWGESTVTWNSSPPADPTPIVSLGAVSSGKWYEVDLSSLITGDGTYSLRVTSTSSDGADYSSREGASGFAPQLVVTLQS